MRTLLILISAACLCIGNEIENFAGVDTTLQLLHITFRHGDRTPDRLYPLDPYTEEDFYPFRIGHLTNDGKRTAYKIGAYLRQKYGTFLGQVYTPDLLYAISSHYARTKASLQAVLAGLYPPTDVLKWNSDLPWEPIPFDSLTAETNKLFQAIRVCPALLILVLQNAAEMSNDPIAVKYDHLLSYLQEVTGMAGYPIIAIAMLLYSTLKAEEQLGLKIPHEFDGIYPEILDELSAASWKYIGGLGDLKVGQSGFLVSQIINNTYATINGEEEAKNRKIYLYSGHDLNIAGLLYFLDNFVPHNPNYGSYILIEVHKYLGVYSLKFLHQNYDRTDPVPLFIPNCGIYCPLELFVKLYEKELDPARLEAICG